MVSWWGIDSYFNIEQIQIGNIDVMISAYGLSGSFGSRIRYKSIGHNTYPCIRGNLRLEPIPFHGTLHKSDPNYLYWRNQLIRLPEAVSKENNLSFVSES